MAGRSLRCTSRASGTLGGITKMYYQSTRALNGELVNKKASLKLSGKPQRGFGKLSKLAVDAANESYDICMARAALVEMLAKGHSPAEIGQAVLVAKSGANAHYGTGFRHLLRTIAPSSKSKVYKARDEAQPKAKATSRSQRRLPAKKAARRSNR
jgi:hypothetical protein